MNTQAQAQAQAITSQTAAAANGRRRQPVQLAKRGTRRSRFAAGLASVLVSVTLLASVVGGFGHQANSATGLAQASQTLLVAKV